MAVKTVALLHPGEMGSAIGACLGERGLRVVWASAGRSAATRARARAAALEDLGPLERALDVADIVLSVCPPHGALALAREVAGHGFTGVYIDANAVSPGTVRDIGRVLEAAEATLVDGGIIGPPPVAGASSRIYLSGGRAKDIAGLFAGSNLEAIPLEGPAGAASALKACYAAWTKGATALLADIRALAAAEGIDGALTREWGESQAGTEKRSEQVVGSARKAWRWISEMQEIAKSFESHGLPGGFHQGAAEIYRRLEGFKDHNPASLAEVTDVLRQAGSADPGRRRRA